MPEWQQDHILDSRFSWIRLEKLARLEEIRLGHALVPGRHNRSIVKALGQEGRNHEAEQVKALIPATTREKPRSATGAYPGQGHEGFSQKDSTCPGSAQSTQNDESGRDQAARLYRGDHQREDGHSHPSGAGKQPASPEPHTQPDAMDI